MSVKLSVILPVYQNEKVETIIKDIHEKIVKQFRSGDVEIIVAEDGSKDNTRKILKSISKKYGLTLNLCDDRRGYIKAVKEIYMQAQGDYVFFTDGDGEHDPSDFWKLWNKIQKENLDLVIGYKTFRSPFYRVFISKINNSLIGFLFGVWLRDANCGFRILKNHVVKDIIPSTGDMKIAWNAETPIRAKKKGYKYSQVPVKHFPIESVVFSKKKLPIDLTKAFIELFKFRVKML
ncbi:MAG: glycosyltransferase family 2 protein [Nanoarchaeota archaeon]